MKAQVEQPRSANPAGKLTVDDMVDDTVVREIEKERSIQRLYR